MKAPPKPPAVVALTVWPTQQKVADLAERLDWDYPHYRAMQKLSEKLEATTTEWSRKQTIQEAQKVIEDFEKRGGRSGVKDGRLGRLWEA